MNFVEEEITLTKKTSLLVSAYAFSPYLGSEFAQAWNYVQHMSQYYKVTVLIGSSDGKIGEVAIVEKLVLEKNLPFKVVVIQPSFFSRVIRFLDENAGLSWLFVLSLDNWHKKALKEAKLLHSESPFDIVHQLGPVGFRNPGYMYKLKIPSYWGPVGGFQFINLKLAYKSSKKYFVVSLIRNVLTYFNARNKKVKNALQGFDTLSFATATNLANFNSIYKVDGLVLSDQACVPKPFVRKKSDLSSCELLVTWCGSLDARKNVRLLLDIALRLKRLESRVFFNVLGDGPLRANAEKLQAKYGLDNIKFKGKVSRDLVDQEFLSSDVVCFTSLSEANTSTLFEGLQRRCIPIALDLDGFSTNISDDIGFRIDACQDYTDIVDEYAELLIRLASEPSLRETLLKGVQEKLADFSWDKLGECHRGILDELYQRTSG
jgi:glycosyltransferase involved in cell wall biosynthesis